MESKEDSIKILEKRIRQQMNYSLEKYMKPENIQYYASSSEMLRKEDFGQESQINESENPQRDIQIDVKGNPQRNIYVDAKGYIQRDILIYERENLTQELRTGEKEKLPQELYIGVENPQQDIDTDEKADLRQETFGSKKEISDQIGYENQPVDMEYINRISGMARMIENMEISETKEAQHAKAKSSYESVRRSLDEEKFLAFQKKGLFDTKG